MAIQDDRPPADPNKRAEWEEAQRQLQKTKADQAEAKRRGEEEVKARRAKAERAEAERQSRQAAEATRRQREQKRKADERAAYLATPLTPDERAELARLKDFANQPGNPLPDAMRRLGDLRTRSKVVVPTEEGQDDKGKGKGKGKGKE